MDDIPALMECLRGLTGADGLDLVLHSSGGSPMAAEAMVTYLRKKFPGAEGSAPDIRVIVPHAAMSAATMLACSARRIVMGRHSYLGPVDPQLLLQTALGVQLVPAQAILAQFKRAQAEARDPAMFAAWIPMLQQYGPGLLVQCENVTKLSEELVKEWLATGMFKNQADAEAKASFVASKLNQHTDHLVHGRYLDRDRVRAIGLLVDDLEETDEFQDAVLTVHHTFAHTFSMMPAVQKIVENHLGKAYIRSVHQQVVPLQFAPMRRP